MESGSSEPQSPAPQAEAAPAPSPPPPQEQPFMEADDAEVVGDDAADKGTMLIVMTAVDPNDLQQPPPQPPTSGGGTILLPAADEFLISSAQLNEERQVVM